MGKTSISARLNDDIVIWLDSKAKKGKTRSDVLNEMLATAMINDQNKEQIQQQKKQAKLLSKGAQAAIMSLRILEVATRQHSNKSDDILKNALILYKDEMHESDSEED